MKVSFLLALFALGRQPEDSNKKVIVRCLIVIAIWSQQDYQEEEVQV